MMTIANGVKHPDTAFSVITTSTGKTSVSKLTLVHRSTSYPHLYMRKMREAPPLRPSSSKIFSYSGQRLPVTGDITMECQYKECSYTGVFHVDTPPASQPILGLPACLQLKVFQLFSAVDSDSSLPQNDSLLTKNSVIEEYEHLFSGLGDLEGEITLHLKENATPVVHPPRRVPHAIKQRLTEELDKMENTGVIDKVTTPTDWVNSLVVVEKENGKLRTCLDPRDLNAAIKRPHYPMPTLEDALAKLTSAKYFSKLDAILPYLIPLLGDTASEDCHLVLSVPEMNFSARWMKSLKVYQASHLWMMMYSSQEEHIKNMAETCKLHLSDPAPKT